MRLNSFSFPPCARFFLPVAVYLRLWVGSEENEKGNKMASNEVTEKILDLLNQSPDAFDALQRRQFPSPVTIPFIFFGDNFQARPWGIIFDHGIRHLSARSSPCFFNLCGHHHAGFGAELGRTPIAFERRGRRLGARPKFGQIGTCLLKDVLYDGSMQIPHLPNRGQGGRLVRYVGNNQ